MKVLFLACVPSPYRVDFFNKLGKHCELTVAFEQDTKGQTHRDSSWFHHNYDHFQAVFLKPIHIRKRMVVCPQIKKLLDPSQFDIIIVGMYSTPTGMLAIQYMKHRRIPFFISCDGGLIKDDHGIKQKIKSHFIRAASAWLSSGKNTDEYLIHYGARAEKIFRYPFTSLEKEDILPHVVSKEEKDACRKELGITADKVVLSVGQFIHRKGYDVLLKSCAITKSDMALYIVGGQPPEEYELMKENAHLDHVHFVGFKKKNELKKYYKAADLFVLPTREDVWGLVINEALAYGLPVVTTDRCVAGLELVQDGKNGFIVPVEDAAGLAEKMDVILSDDPLREQFSLRSLSKIQGYTIEDMAMRHLEIFEQFLRS